jgi:flagellar hook-length control protein FliK
MNALPIAVGPLAAPASVPSGAASVGGAAPSGTTPSGSGTTQNFAAALGASSDPTEASVSKPAGQPAAAGTAAKTGKSKSAPAAGGDATLTGMSLPLAGNPLPPDVSAAPAAGGNSTGSGNSMGGASDAASRPGTVASSAPLTAADLSAAAAGGGGTGSSSDLKSAFSRLLGDGIEHLPPGLSADAPRVAGGAPTTASAAASGAADRARTAAEPTAAAGSGGAAGATAGAAAAAATASATAGSAAGIAADAAVMAGNPSAETDALAFNRERGGSGASSAATATATASASAGTGDGGAAGAAGGAGAANADGLGVGGGSDAMANAGAQTRTAISAIAAAVGGSGKHSEAANLVATAADGVSASALMGSAAPAPDAAGATQTKIDAPITSPEFTQAFASRVSYLVDNNLNGATLQVTPPQLGPIELRITIEAGHAQVSMSAHNPATLDALQAGAPKLRELLSAQGFGQVSVDVSQRSFQDGSPYAQSRPWTPSSESDDTVSAADVSVAAARAPLGMLDAYA